jgi:hypothetical protein
MTATSSPKDLLAAYRLNARTEAAADGAPGNRASFPGLAIDATGMIYLRGKTLTYQPISNVPETLTPEKLAELLVEPEASVVVADLHTHARMMVMADNMPSSDFKALARRLRMSRGLPLSVKLPILTEALARRYWLQDGLNDSSLDDWAAAFGIRSPSQALRMRDLIDLASDGIRPASLKYGATVKAMEELEQKIIKNCEWSTLSNDCYVYGMLESATTRASGLKNLDPGLLEMHTIDGTVCKIVPMDLRHRTFTSSVSSPFKLKEGKKSRITDGQEFAEVTMESLRFGDGALHAVFTQPPARSAGPLMISRSHNSGAPLYAMEDPFDLPGRALKNKRWLGEPVKSVTGRDVPLDVVLAGAPVE